MRRHNLFSFFIKQRRKVKYTEWVLMQLLRDYSLKIKRSRERERLNNIMSKFNTIKHPTNSLSKLPTLHTQGNKIPKISNSYSDQTSIAKQASNWTTLFCTTQTNGKRDLATVTVLHWRTVTVHVPLHTVQEQQQNSLFTIPKHTLFLIHLKVKTLKPHQIAYQTSCNLSISISTSFSPFKTLSSYSHFLNPFPHRNKLQDHNIPILQPKTMLPSSSW